METYIHIGLQLLLLAIWLFTIYNTVAHRKTLPLNIFGMMLTASVLMVYIISSNLILFDLNSDTIVWNRFEWYGFDIVTAIILNKVVCVSKRINKYLNWFAKGKNHDD